MLNNNDDQLRRDDGEKDVRYFVSYACVDKEGDYAMGNGEISYPHLIGSMADVEAIEAQLCETYAFTYVKLQNFQRLYGVPAGKN